MIHKAKMNVNSRVICFGEYSPFILCGDLNKVETLFLKTKERHFSISAMFIATVTFQRINIGNVLRISLACCCHAHELGISYFF